MERVGFTVEEFGIREDLENGRRRVLHERRRKDDRGKGLKERGKQKEREGRMANGGFWFCS